MKPLLERRVAGAFLIALVCIAGIGIVQYYTVRKLNQNTQLAAHSQAILTELRMLRTGLNRQDAAAQTFALTDDPKYLAPFPQAEATWTERTKNLRTLTANEAAQQSRVDKLETSLDSSLRYLQAEVDLRKTGTHLDQTPELVASVEKSLDDSRAVIAEMENSEIAAFRERNEAGRRATHEANLFILFGGALGIALLGGFAVTLYRGIAELTRSEAMIEAQAKLLNAANDAIFVRTAEGTISYWNGGAERLYGWTKDEALGKSPAELVQTQFPVPFDEIVRCCEQGDWRGVLIQQRRDGTKIAVESRWSVTKNAENNFTGWLEINRDITERLHAEEELRAVSGRLLQLQEDERRHLGRELHDSLGQYLSVLKMNLDTLLPHSSPENDDRDKMLTECIQLADQSLTEVRTASYLLYPPLLDELGLQSAVSWYLDGFSKRSGIQTTYEIPVTLGRMHRDVELALFRVLQESLTNVHRHSGSPTVHVRVATKEGDFSLEVQDGGTGIPEERLNEFYNGLPGKLGVGLRGMHERIRQFGGKLEVFSNPQGTIVRAVVPLVQPNSVSRASV